MTDNQFKQLFDLVTKTVNGIQRLEGDVAILKQDMSEVKSDVAELKSDVGELKSDVGELKSDVGELKDGQKRIEKQMRLNNAAFDSMAGEYIRLKNVVNDMEKATA